MFGPMKCFSKQDRMSYEVPQSFADTGCLHILVFSSLQICSADFSKSQYFSFVLGSAFISLHWKRGNSYNDMLSAKGIFDCCSENLIGSKISTSSTKFVFFFRADQKTKIAALADLSTTVAHCTQVHDMSHYVALLAPCLFFNIP